MMGVQLKKSDLFVFVSIVVLAENVYGDLNCYSCSSQIDDRCGVSWGYNSAGEVPATYLATCVGNRAACRKMVTRDGPAGFEVVERSCWNSTEPEMITEDFYKCSEIMEVGDLCFCNTVNCNGQERLLATATIATTAALATVFNIIKNIL